MKRLVKASGDASVSDIQDVLQAYETALNSSDIDAVLKVFTADAVFMAPNSASAIGAEAIRPAYTVLFETIAFDTELTVEEVVQVAPDWAFVRTTSSGFVTLQAIDQRVSDANHELFVFRNEAAGGWKIARYAFSTTNPRAQ